MIGTLLAPLVFVKSALFYGLMTRFKLRARTSLLATLNLSNYWAVDSGDFLRKLRATVGMLQAVTVTV